MAFFDNIFPPLASDLITKFGISVRFKLPGSKRFVPRLGQTIKSTGTEQTVVATPPYEFSKFKENGETVRQGDMKISIAGSDLTFKIDNSMTVIIPITDASGTIVEEEWKVIDIRIHRSGNQVAVFELQLRR